MYNWFKRKRCFKVLDDSKNTIINWLFTRTSNSVGLMNCNIVGPGFETLQSCIHYKRLKPYSGTVLQRDLNHCLTMFGP